MTPTELRAAAGRVWRAKAGEHPYAIYGEDDAVTQGWHDRKVLAEAYLAEHPADDDEPITAEWLDTLTRDKEEPVYWRLSAGPRSPGVIRVDVFLQPSYCTVRVGHHLLYEWWNLAGGTVGRRYTRGQLRRLCAALHIPLKPTEGQS